jgi:leucyl aminopeptidase
MIKLFKKTPDKYTGDLIAFFIKQPQKGAPHCAFEQIQEYIKRAHAAGDFTGKEGQTLLFYPDGTQKNKWAQRCLLVGLGKEKITRDIIRIAGGIVSSAAHKTKAKKILAVAPSVKELATDEVVECLTEGLVLGAYQFKKYKTRKDPDNNDVQNELQEIAVYSDKKTAAQKGLERGKNAALAACSCRDMANEPANHWTAAHFADYGRQLAQKYAFSCTILSKTEMKRLGLEGILAVNSGSAEPPKMVILEYRSGRKVPTLLLVGKGLTFDTGGISLKPSTGMHDMKYDMSGGAAVLAVMEALGKEKPLNLDVIAIVPATDNPVGPASVKPGDVITMYGGKTVEVINTDAEGRLILADAITYGIKKFKPDMIIDIATLTGAVIVGLGNHRTGLLSNNKKMVKKLVQAGEKSGEPLWQLPLGKEYTKQLKSEIADLKNVGSRAGGTITAASFLQEFVGKTKWAHLDIAGTAWDFTEKSYIPKGPSGVGVRTLLEFIRGWE